jgi:hypothetical protein
MSEDNMSNDSRSRPIQKRAIELVKQHGGIRPAARVLRVDHGYMSRLVSGEKDNPSDLVLHRMGLERIVTYRRL